MEAGRVKFTIPIPEPSYPALPFALNIRAGVQLDPSGGMFYLEFGDTETPVHPRAQRFQAERAWTVWDLKWRGRWIWL
jgi:hypothetical protein